MTEKNDDDFSIVDGPNNKGSSTGLDENVAGLLCYLGVFVTGIVFLVLEKKSNFVRFHAMQSTVLFLMLWIGSMIINIIPFVGGIISSLIWVLSVVLWIVLMIKAYQKEKFEVPIVTDLARSFLGNK